ncbi:MAG: glycosyltransferase family 2 protein [Candidatus Nanoarchaeia archaeon]|nr:glycosyltransferase family 2 protein [Candidatus Nanoarchaeia archaeon]
MLIDILLMLLIISIVLFSWTWIGYPIFLLIASLLFKKRHLIDDNHMPKVTMMIMSYNEAKVIEKKIKNSLEIDYPKNNLEIFVVDSASNDGTQDIVNKYSERVRLIEQGERKGKASAINYGKKYASGDIIIITDSNAMMNKDAVKKIARHFSDKKVGGVCGRFEARDIRDTSVGAGGSIYWKIEKFLRQNESIIDSSIHMSGEITAFRKHVVKKVDESSLSEDFDMAIRIRKAGFRIIYEPEAVAFEPAPENVKDLSIQKRRITIGTWQGIAKHKNVLFNPRYGWYGTVILPSHKLFQILTPFILILVFFLSAVLWLLTKDVVILGFLMLQGIAYFLTLISFIPLRIIEKCPLFVFIKYFMATNWILLLGFFDFIRKRRIVTWKKIESSRNF